MCETGSDRQLWLVAVSIDGTRSVSFTVSMSQSIRSCASSVSPSKTSSILGLQYSLYYTTIQKPQNNSL